MIIYQYSDRRICHGDDAGAWNVDADCDRE